MTTPTAEVKLPQWLAEAKGLPRYVEIYGVHQTTAKAAMVDMRHVIRGSDNCHRCGRDIANEASKLVGFGPDCCELLGIPRPEVADAAHYLETAQAVLGQKTWRLWVPRQLVPAAILEAAPVEQAKVALATPGVAAPDGTRVITQSGSKVIATFAFVHALKDDLKQVGFQWDKGASGGFDSSVWTITPTPENHSLVVKVLQKWAFTVAPNVLEWIAGVGQRQAAVVAASAATDADLEVPGLQGTLRPFQRAGVAYAIERGGVTFIADEMGLGKTIQAISTVQCLPNAYPCIVVCPATLKRNWEREWNRWLPNRRVQVLEGTTPYAIGDMFLGRPDVIVLNYDIAYAWGDSLVRLQPKALICDESHALKTPKTRRTDAVTSIAKHCAVKLLLSGTPLLNRPTELISQLKILGKLDEVGGFNFFRKRYCGYGMVDRFGAPQETPQHLDELNTKLRSLCYVRRLKKDVLLELPAKQIQFEPMQLTNRTAYKEAEDNIIAFLADRAARDVAFLESLEGLTDAEAKEATKERRSTVSQKAAAAEALVKMEALRLLTAEGKLKAAIEWTREFLEDSDQKLVLFASHIEIQRALCSAFPDAAHVLGADNMTVRQEMVDRFQNDPKTRLIVCSLQAAGVGITLTAASHVAFLELGYTPAIHSQAEDRVHRIGQRDAVTAHYLLAEDTIDETVWRLIEGKRVIVTQASDGGEAPVSNASVFKDVVATYLKRG